MVEKMKKTPAKKGAVKTVAKKSTKKTSIKASPTKNIEKKGTLVIVESPSKAKTISNYLGRGFSVVASVGHVIDLPRKKISVDIENNFAPTYDIMDGKKKILNDIIKKSKTVTRVLLAPDPDREGEAIAKHLADYIDTKIKKDRPEVKRILINEITSKGVKKALENILEIDVNKFHSQQARRILDRLVGYKISPILWEKIAKGLSAGRVQSIALRFIVDREREIRNFKPKEYWNLKALFKFSKGELEGKLDTVDGKKIKEKELNRETLDKILKRVENKKEVTVLDLTSKTRKRSPQPPFTTSKLQQDASYRLGFTPKKTMAVAQKLYEGVSVQGELKGLITYMRTDSFRVSDDIRMAAVEYVHKTYGKEYAPDKGVVYKSKKSAQDAHEAIRPTDVSLTPERAKPFLTSEQYRLYSLIWKRFIASQMSNAVYDQYTVNIAFTDEQKIVFKTAWSVQKFAGFTSLYEMKKEDEKTGLLLEKGVLGELLKLDPEQKFTQPPPRFNDASLVKELEEKGIGRPSTYASILSTIQTREYVLKNEKKQLEPTELGEVVCDVLIEFFPKIMDASFTAEMEESLDTIEYGKLNWVKLLDNFYKDFKPSLEHAEKSINIKKEEATDIKCPSCKSPMVIKWSRRGQFLACTSYPKCKTTMNFERDGDKVVPVERKEELSDEKCPKCDSQMTVKVGRYGKFLACINYPTCKGTKPITTKIKCPDCGKGELTQRRTKRGRIFYGCTNYPECKNAMWDFPVEKKCPECGHPIMGESKTQRKCPKCGHKEKL